MHIFFVSAYLTAFTSGLSVSWTSPVIPKFKTEENPFNHTVSTTQVAMLASFLPLGAITGPVLAGMEYLIIIIRDIKGFFLNQSQID